jgi:hypothetical protein
MAFPVYIDCGNCQEESTTLTQAGLQTGFRLFRWLEIAAHANYYQVGSPAFSWATEALNQDLDFVYFDQQIRGVNVTIGPRLLLRVWQGDLSLEARYGFLWESGKLEWFQYLGRAVSGFHQCEQTRSQSGASGVHVLAEKTVRDSVGRRNSQ